ncbi:MAG: SLC13 family permease [Deltaproteobacteria bacterium]|nr:SLC13 family permease [Deltaproteobacteria bacterium]
MQEVVFTNQMWLVLGMIGLALLLFITEWVRVDVVGLLMMTALPLMGLLDPRRAFSGLASNAVISIGAVMVIGAGMDKAGLIRKLVKPVIGLAGNRSGRLVVLISAFVAVVSSFLQNIGAAALVLPALQRISRRMDLSISRLLMPIGFACILGGTLTLVGSSPLIMLNDLIAPFHLEKFSLYSVTPIGLCLITAGIAYFLLLGRWVLPGGDEAETRLAGCLHHGPLGRHFELTVPPELPGPLTAQMMRAEYQTFLVGLAKFDGGGKHMAPDERVAVYPGDTLAVVAETDNLNRLIKDYGLVVSPQMEVFKEELKHKAWGLAEGIVGPRSELVGKTLGEFHFRSKFRINVLAVYRGDEVFETDLDELVLKNGDAIQLEGTWDRFRVLRDQGLLIFCTEVLEEPIPRQKTLWATFWFAVAMTLLLGFGLKLSLSLLTGALGMVISRVVTIQEAYRAVDWRTVFLLAGLMPLGYATTDTGTADAIAKWSIGLFGTLSPLTLYALLAVLATFLTLVVSNVGAVVLLVPLAIHMAQQTGADPRLAALVVGIGTSNSFLLPTHQVNALYMGAGRYHTLDFVKAGSGMSLLFLAIVVFGVRYLYG